MRIPFTKMHGLGNDFVVIQTEGGILLPGDTIRDLGDRRTGIGFDQLLLLEPPRTEQRATCFTGFSMRTAAKPNNAATAPAVSRATSAAKQIGN